MIKGITSQYKVNNEIYRFYRKLFKQNNKSTGNDGLTKEFHEIFWNEISEPLLKSVQYAKSNQRLNFSQRQAIIKLLEKKIEIKDIKQNWRHISLFNANTKI